MHTKVDCRLIKSPPKLIGYLQPLRHYLQTTSLKIVLVTSEKVDPKFDYFGTIDINSFLSSYVVGEQMHILRSNFEL